MLHFASPVPVYIISLKRTEYNIDFFFSVSSQIENIVTMVDKMRRIEGTTVQQRSIRDRDISNETRVVEKSIHYQLHSNDNNKTTQQKNKKKNTVCTLP